MNLHGKCSDFVPSLPEGIVCEDRLARLICASTQFFNDASESLLPRLFCKQAC